MMYNWNEKEAVKEAIVDIISFLDNFHGYEDEIEPELRDHIQQKYGIYSDVECIKDPAGHPIEWKRNIIVEERAVCEEKD